MDSPIWLRSLRQNVGFGTFFTFVAGVIAVINFIMATWSGLDSGHRLWATVSGIVFMGALIAFIVLQTRKILNVIPSLLLDKHRIVKKYANSINRLREEDIDKFYELLKYIGQRVPNPNNTEDEIHVEITEECAEGAVNYLMDKSGIITSLENDTDYIRANRRFGELILSVSSMEVIEAIRKFNRESRATAMLPIIFHNSLPSQYTSITGLNPNELEDFMLKSRVKVIESIEKYYKGEVTK